MTKAEKRMQKLLIKLRYRFYDFSYWRQMVIAQNGGYVLKLHRKGHLTLVHPDRTETDIFFTKNSKGMLGLQEALSRTGCTGLDVLNGIRTIRSTVRPGFRWWYVLCGFLRRFFALLRRWWHESKNPF